MCLANGSVQIANGSVRIFDFAGSVPPASKINFAARKHGTSKWMRPCQDIEKWNSNSTQLTDAAMSMEQ